MNTTPCPKPEPSHLDSSISADIAHLLPEESSVDPDGVLLIGDVRVDTLAAEFRTPLHIFDEAGLRRQIRRFVDGLRARWSNSRVVFASKALPIQAMYAIAQSEGLCVDVAGLGELELAMAAKVDPSRIYFHGNAKTEEEIRAALRYGVGCFIVDNSDELTRLESLVRQKQQVLIRVNPEVPVNVHPNQVTAHSESKFGLSFADARELAARIARHPHLSFLGVHLHLGSQILDPKPFGRAVEAASEFSNVTTYDIGGGLGVPYYREEMAPTVEEYLDTITEHAHRFLPPGSQLLIEPGRSIVARAGVTLYRVVSVKSGPKKRFVAVDGGMADQLDIALTDQRYEAFNASRMLETHSTLADVVGRQCESGDLLVRDASLAETKVGDLIVMPVTGAYSYTTTNNYNGAMRPAVVFVANGTTRLAVRRETVPEFLQLHEPANSVDWNRLP